MKSELITVFLGFLEGFVLILSPCILSILPIILASSLAGSKKRSLGIIIGFMLIFTLFALFTRQLVEYSGIDSNLIRYIAYGFLFLLALILLSNYLTALFSQISQRIERMGSFFVSLRQNKNGFFSGLFLGGLVAIIWTPCAGPILAAIIVQIVIQKTTMVSVFTLLAFAMGAAIPMFIITLYGFKIMDSFQFFKRHTVLIRKTLGAIILLNLGYMIGQEYGVFSSSVINQSTIRTANYLQKGVWLPYKAPQIEGIDTWINSLPLKQADLKDKVVLIDFWTYSCINCIRTIPFLNKWYEKYHDKGLVIVGIHSPEFDFEKNAVNVKNAVKSYGIQYPVALDNSFINWRNFSNHYWPAQYLINKEGTVVYEHFGEGDDDVIESNIRFLLGLVNTNSTIVLDNTPNPYGLTPETYLGFARANTSLSPDLIHDKEAEYLFTEQLTANSWSLQGTWQVMPDKIIAPRNNASLKIHFTARKVFVVMGSSTKTPIQVNLLLNGKPVTTADQGKNVMNSSILVDKYALYEVIVLPQLGNGVLELSPIQPGLELYTFTFGG